MNLREIARNGMKGRKKDSLLLKLVVSLSFAFITAGLIFQASMEATKTEQKKQLYGSWQAAYLDGDEDTYQKLKKDKEVRELTFTSEIGKTTKLGTVGTMGKEFLQMGGFSLYKGELPKAENEIAVELNQLSSAGLELEVGQKLLLDIAVVTIDENINEEINQNLQTEYYNSYSEPNALIRYGYHDNPSRRIGDTNVIVSTDYVFYFRRGEPSDEKTIKEKGLITHQEVVLQKEFTITGIINTYSDKWDMGGHSVPSAFVTEAAGDKLLEDFRNNSFIDVSAYKIPMDLFFNLKHLTADTVTTMSEKYPSPEAESEDMTALYNRVWLNIKKAITPEDRDQIKEYYSNIQVEPSKEDTGLTKDTVSEDSTSNFRRNSFTYPDTSNSVEHLITFAVLGIIFVTTVCAVFQIFLTQIRRRSRKLVLLKSIGATKGQLLRILFWEAVYLWRTGLLMGVLGGSLLSILILCGMKLFGNERLVIDIPSELLMLGILVGSISLFAGVLLPAVSAVNIPLTGTLAKKQKHSKVVYHGKQKRRKPVKQNFFHITLRYFKNNRGRGLLAFAISVFIISILTASLYLSYNSFSRYRDSVRENGRPDYTMRAVYGENQNKLPDIKAELMQIKGVKAVENFKFGKKLLFWYEVYKEDTILKAFEDQLPNELKQEHFSKYVSGTAEQPAYISDAYYSYYYGIDTESESGKKLLAAVTEGSVDMEKFKAGEEVILLVPLTMEGKLKNSADSLTEYEKVKAAVGLDKRMSWLLKKNKIYYTSLDRRYKELYQSESKLKPGDTLYLSTDREKIGEEERIIGFNTAEVKVGGIIHYFPEGGSWPFSDLVPYYTVIGSMDGMEVMYPNSKMGLFRVNLEQMTEMIKILYPTAYGRTLWNITAEDRENPEVLDAALLAFANNKGFTLYNYRESSERMLAEALNNTMIISLLGLISCVIALIAFYNTSVSKMEQERNRIGILQSMGVTKGQFARQYIFQGIIQGTAAVIVTSAAMLLLLSTVTAITSEVPLNNLKELINQVMAGRLWLYPWKLHGAVGGIFIALVTILQLIPAMAIAKQYPVDNIRSLGR